MQLHKFAPALILVSGACETSTEWTPKYPNQPEYKPLVSVASRIRRARDACPSDERVNLGVVHVDGRVDRVDVIQELAEEAANRGGTHYVVASDVTEVDGADIVGAHYGGVLFGRARFTKSEHVWAIVYRCPSAVP